MKLNEKLKKYRNQNNLTQAEVAQKLNVSRKTISAWENGRSRPDQDAITALANLYDISTNELIGSKPKGSSQSKLTFRQKMIRIKRYGYISKYAYFFELVLLVIGVVLFILPFNLHDLWLIPLFVIDLCVIILYEKNWKTITDDKPLMKKIEILSPILWLVIFLIGCIINLDAMLSHDLMMKIGTIIGIIMFSLTLSVGLILGILFPLKRMTVKRSSKN
ncbi:helix-turn-helix domain-containing protein [Fructilactobacillus fructivorans]|uniref:Helix-turn-helix domain-containing protein n=1 Tax=Fructilactobacillus fructivorans TaxID=1614 RepID=A0AAE6P169_9LACO|nr:helix-turn-helix transcriptional regulator [Fructilactobacillus fructivorans]KRK57757.1 hypothetical protein FC73_GL000765 [Fructilactobacillus fructivorans]KRN12702.1 hypothetical protein IV37_GL001002 [Fructilactobacillus fructivorans]KRN40634.1 hypothetical protein IV51_GL001255 [Fructilactobacillus fructivorans]KRN43175.1 hypothetical protein IV48_GL000730 [Fructilactobacillus fructivorans]QFX92965.1 helix-turn-helix domain-containing protein [Fructilactobacillus fructivorans]